LVFLREKAVHCFPLVNKLRKPLLTPSWNSSLYTGSRGRLSSTIPPKTLEPTEILDYQNPLVYNLVKAGVHPQRVKELYFDKPRTQAQQPRTSETPRPTPKKEKTPQTFSFTHYRILAGLSLQEEEEIFNNW
jgi:hypothetical protein